MRERSQKRFEPPSPPFSLPEDSDFAPQRRGSDKETTFPKRNRIPFDLVQLSNHKTLFIALMSLFGMGSHNFGGELIF